MLGPPLSLAEAARMLRVSVTTMQRYLADGRVPGWKTPGGHWRVWLKDLIGGQEHGD